VIWGGIVIGGLYALISVGLTIMFGAASNVNLAHGDFMMLGSFGAYWFLTLWGIEPLLSLVLVGFICAGIGALLYLGVFSRLYARELPKSLLETTTLLLTFALFIIVVNGASWAWSTGFVSYSYLTGTVEFLGIHSMLNRLAIPLISVPSLLAIYFLTKKTWWGRGIDCVIENKRAAMIVGVNLRRVYMYCYTLGFGTVGMAGVLYSMSFMFTPFIGLEYTMAAFVVIILGGVGSIMGALVGGLLVGIIESTLVSVLSPALKIPIIYGILIVVLMVRPRGIFGRK